MKGYLAAALCVAALVAVVARSCAEQGDAPPDPAVIRALEHTRDSLKARTAEQIISAKAESDSLKRLLSRAPRVRVDTLRDTVPVPKAEYVFIYDTVIPKCHLCALRTDSLVEAIQAERRIARHIEDGMRGEIARLKRERLLDRVGVTVGYGVTKVGNDVKAGPQVGISVRVLP